MRRRRRRVFREDVLAPWLTLLVILAFWWLGARVLSPNLAEPDRPASMMPTRPSAERLVPAPDSSSAQGTAPRADATRALPDRGDAALEAPLPAVSASDIEQLRARRLAIPVAGIQVSSLTSSFDDARGGGSRTHEALDILAPRGTPVVAVQDGRIAKLFTSAAGGLTIYQFDPQEQYSYYYAHLDGYDRDVKEGQDVRRGQTIGYVGTTGNAPLGTPHLHFAIFKLGPDKRWWEGEAIDPYRVLR